MLAKDAGTALEATKTGVHGSQSAVISHAQVLLLAFKVIVERNLNLAGNWECLHLPF